MERAVEEVQMPILDNRGMTENLSALELEEQGFSAVTYTFILIAAKLKSICETLQALKTSLPIGPPPTILSAAEVCEGVGFNKYWALEDKYATQEVKTKLATNGNNKANGIASTNSH
ncbi:carboxyphosphonoenolpyruvate phosphonomutase [Fusarium sp. NRRL 52700]|nr:carboxyphosphonoenolpyruvate phosphonomutase [Fusarium sp. NRRL 52700]